jgi:hypothetical protein
MLPTRQGASICGVRGLEFVKTGKKIAYNVKDDDGGWIGIIDYSHKRQTWRFTPEADMVFSVDALHEIVHFLDSLKDKQGNEVLENGTD